VYEEKVVVIAGGRNFGINDHWITVGKNVYAVKVVVTVEWSYFRNKRPLNYCWKIFCIEK